MKVAYNNTLSILRGDSDSIVLNVTKEGVQVPFIDGDAVHFTVKTSFDSTTKLIHKIVSSFPEGKAVIALEPSDTNNLSFRPYKYDLKVVRNTGVVTTFSVGNFVLEQGVGDV